jgi:hypothetical protein
LGIGRLFACNFQKFFWERHGSSLSMLVTREVFSFIRYSLYFLFFPHAFQLQLVCFLKNTGKASRFSSPLSGGGKNLEIVPEYKYQIPFFVQGIAYIYESIYKSHAIDE